MSGLPADSLLLDVAPGHAAVALRGFADGERDRVPCGDGPASTSRCLRRSCCGRSCGRPFRARCAARTSAPTTCSSRRAPSWPPRSRCSTSGAGQGLAVKGAALEEIYQEFGHGESTPHAIHEFIAHAYHFWPGPSPRYVVLLGDASYDDGRPAGRRSNPVPTLLVKTSFLWTASDLIFAAVNGEDLLPDLALGRLPAASVAEAEPLVEKIVAYESAGLTLAGARRPRRGQPRPGRRLRDQRPGRRGALLAATHTVESVFVRELGAATRPTITAAFDRGASLVSYLGHGGIAVWASENVFNNQDVAALSARSPSSPCC